MSILAPSCVCQQPLSLRSYRQHASSGRQPFLQQRPCLRQRKQRLAPCAALEIDWSDPDTLVGVAGAVLGLAVGIGAPLFYISRDTKDREKLEMVREMNRKRFAETGEYMTDEEIRQLRQPRWTDAREFQDDD